MPFIDLDSTRLYYQLIGQGRPVVFVNGWTMSCEYWMPLIEQLKDQHLCLVYDARGFARSRPLSASAGVDIDDHVEDLHTLINRLGLKDVNLVGHGLGAWTAILCTRRHPQDVITLTAVAPESEPQQEEKLAEAPTIWQQASLLLKDLAALPVLRNLVAWRYRQVAEPYRTQLCEDFAQADRRVAYNMLASVMGVDNQERLQQALSELVLPVLLARGMQDRLCPEPLFRRLFTLINRGKMATVRGCGHLPMLEYTKEFATLLADFFAKNAKPSRQALTRV
ncbi:MAG: alpha/beta hydrolase [Acidobacteriota bacterium]